ncbi:MAG: nucleoid occlusion factor SlmA [Pseudomonadota bacterium]
MESVRPESLTSPLTPSSTDPLASSAAALAGPDIASSAAPSLSPPHPAEPPADGPDASAQRRRPKPGERRTQILHTLAAMLEQPGGERVTTAALAARLQVSEAALYRHFASKAQMFEALIEFIESSVFTLVNQVLDREADPGGQARHIVALVLQFGEKNPGMARVMVGDALVLEHERLSARMDQFFDRLESQLRQCLRHHATAHGLPAPTVWAQGAAANAVSLLLGRLHRHIRSGFRRAPTEHLDTALLQILAA